MLLGLAVIGLVVALAGCRGGESEERGSVTVNPVAAPSDAEPASTSITSESCPVTVPNRTVRPGAGFTAAGFNYGGTRLRAHLYWPRGTLTAGMLPNGGAMAVINTDGSISAKVGWWRGLRGTLSIEGRRLDESAPPLLADVPEGYGSLGFQPTGLTFPTVGCWRVVGKVEPARLMFVVRVTKARASSG